MSGENVEVVRRLYDAVAGRDFDAVLALYHEEVEWDFSHSPVGDAMSQKHYRGHEGLRLWWREWSEAWQTYRDGYDELIDANDHVISVVTSRGRGRASGAEVDWTQYGVWSFREGQIVRVAWFGEREDALAAAGSPGRSVGLPIASAFDAIGRLDADALVHLCDPEVCFESRITAVEDATYRGHEGARRYIANLADAFDWIEVEPSEVVEAGDRVVVTNRFRGCGRGSGVEVEERYFVAAKGRSGRLVWWGFFDTRDEALEAVGLGGR